MARNDGRAMISDMELYTAIMHMLNLMPLSLMDIYGLPSSILRLHAAKIGAGNVIKKKFITFPIAYIPGFTSTMPYFPALLFHLSQNGFLLFLLFH